MKLVWLLVFIPFAALSSEWKIVGVMPFPVTGAQAVVYEGNIYLLGGVREDSLQTATDLIQVFNPRNGTWSTSSGMAASRAGFVAGVYGDSLLITGGVMQQSPALFSVELWDFKNAPRFYQFRDVFNRRFATGGIYGQNLYLFGGFAFPISPDTSETPYIVEFNIPTSSVTFVDDSLFGGSPPYQQMSVVCGERFYIFGGVLFSISNRVYSFTPEDRRFVRLSPDLIVQRAGGKAIQFDEKTIYLIGGYNETATALSPVEIFLVDEQNHYRNELSVPLNNSRTGLAAVKFENAIYVFGGVDEHGVMSSTVEKLDVNTSVKEPPITAETFTLQQNYPNPFNAGTTITFNLLGPSMVSLNIYTVTGQHVKTLVQTRLDAGGHRLHWQGRDEAGQAMPSGVYIYELSTGALVISQKMLLIR